MTGTNATAPDPPVEQEFVISRVFNAPRDLVWKVLTESEHLAKWWGPKSFTMTVANVDLRPGGTFHYAMRGPNGVEMWGKFVYREIVAPELLVFVNSFSDAEGGITRHPWSATWPLEVLNHLTLAEQSGKTTMTQRGRPINASAEESATFAGGHDSMRQGFSGTYKQLDEYLASIQEGQPS